MTKPAPPPTLGAFERQLRAVGQTLQATLEEVRAQLKHPGNKGSGAEAAFRRVLSRFLPRSFAVGEGEVIDTHDNRSGQCDVVIVTLAHPNWVTQDEPALFLIEGVAAVAEVKAVLNSQNLATAMESAARFRKLSPAWAPSTAVTGTPDEVARYYTSPPLFLFAYESEVAIETIASLVGSAADEGAGRRDESFDAVFVLGKGYVINFGRGNRLFVAQGSEGDRLEGYYWDDDPDTLTRLMMWLPPALVAPQVQVPVLSPYLLADVSGKGKKE